MSPTQMQFLERINTDLKQVIEVASIDFSEINSLLKTHYHNVKKEKVSLEKFSMDETKIEAMMSGLQYMDVFSQRVEHLIVTHQRMMSNGLASDFAESFFHLHVFHAMTIELDLLRAISTVKSLLIEERNYLNGVGQVNWTEQEFFSHTSSIKRILKETIERLREAGGDTGKLPIPPLSEAQVRILNSLYTMESERVVLAWFLNAMPSGTWEELSHYYENAIYQADVENTELF